MPVRRASRVRPRSSGYKRVRGQRLGVRHCNFRFSMVFVLGPWSLVLGQTSEDYLNQSPTAIHRPSHQSLTPIHGQRTKDSGPRTKDQGPRTNRMELQPLVLINAVGLTRKLLAFAPRLTEIANSGWVRSLNEVVPAVTCTAQASILTG